MHRTFGNRTTIIPASLRDQSLGRQDFAHDEYFTRAMVTERSKAVNDVWAMTSAGFVGIGERVARQACGIQVPCIAFRTNSHPVLLLSPLPQLSGSTLSCCTFRCRSVGLCALRDSTPACRDLPSERLRKSFPSPITIRFFLTSQSWQTRQPRPIAKYVDSDPQYVIWIRTRRFARGNRLHDHPLARP